MATKNARTVTAQSPSWKHARRVYDRRDWSRLPVATCGCGARFSQEVAGQTDCRDCMSTNETGPYAPTALRPGDVIRPTDILTVRFGGLGRSRRVRSDRVVVVPEESAASLRGFVSVGLSSGQVIGLTAFEWVVAIERPELPTSSRRANDKLAVAAHNLGLSLSSTASVAKINAVLREAGYAERLTAGRGYYYWREGDGIRWPSVYVYRCGDSNLAWWLYEAAERITNAV